MADLTSPSFTSPTEMTMDELRGELVKAIDLKLTIRNWHWVRALAFELSARSLEMEVQAEAARDSGRN